MRKELRVNKQAWLASILVVAVLLIDQIIKMAVKTSMYIHESIRITDWFYIYFTENKGMAFGMELFDKFFLTSFRIIMVIAISVYLFRIIRRGINTGYVVCCALVLAGAAGNIIDCVFYGLIFNSPPPPIPAEFVSFGTGYETAFHGRVVDMFYFPIIDTHWPSWLPWLGGDRFIFFSPVFNFADAAISCGMISILLFYRAHLPK